MTDYKKLVPEALEHISNGGTISTFSKERNLNSTYIYRKVANFNPDIVKPKDTYHTSVRLKRTYRDFIEQRSKEMGLDMGDVINHIIKCYRLKTLHQVTI
jgi:hypothetical protein